MHYSFFKEFRHFIEWALCAVLFWAVPRLPRRACVALADALGYAAFHLDGRGRRVALANLACAFPEKPLRKRRWIARRSYQIFARNMIDLLWSPSLTRENWRRYIEVEADEAALIEQSKAHGSVSMCIHWGDFEWASHAFGFLGIPTLIVMEAFKNPRLGGFFKKVREISGHTLIEQDKSMIRLLKRVKHHEAAGMLVDLTLKPDQAAVPIDAFGRKMCVTMMHAVLVQRAGALMFPVDGIPLPDGRCRVVIHPALALPEGASIQQIAQACWDAYEPRIHEHPEFYLWAYKHWRYRPASAPAETYPFYANVSSKFEKLLKEHEQKPEN